MTTCATCGTECDDGAAACPADGTPLAPDPLLGRVVDERYRLLARIGQGGMGTVYRAEHVLLRKRVAVKVLRRELSLDDDLVRRFQQEAIAASQIGQENIVDVTDFGRTPDGALYFVMEELEGQSLAALLRTAGPLPVARAALVLAQVCRALAAAHGRGIVHRDLKPDNVIITRRDDGSDFVKVVDFGISKNGAGPERGRITRAGTIIGTPEYMAPEQGAAATVDHRADVYAFGVLAYELVTGSLPFHGESAIATLLEHQVKPPEPPSRRRPGLLPELEALILRALEKRPAARQQSMAEVAADLTRVLSALGLPPVYERAPTPPPGHGPLAGLTERFEAGAPPARRHSTGRGATLALEAPLRAPPPPRPSRRLAAFGAAALLAALGMGGAVAWARRGAALAPAVGSAGSSSPQQREPAASGAAVERSGPATATSSDVPSAVATRGAVAAPQAERASAERPPAASASTSRVATATTPPDPAAHRASPARATRRPAPEPGLGERRRTDENPPFGKLDDLKPDPF
jgi:serine/threonine-protein kinase